jgi:hypothetical protein
LQHFVQFERAICAYVNGVRKDAPEFSDKHSAERVAGYMSSCSKLGDGHWKEILDACSVENQNSHSENEFADLSLLDKQRDDLFAFSSPLKG